MLHRSAKLKSSDLVMHKVVTGPPQRRWSLPHRATEEPGAPSYCLVKLAARRAMSSFIPGFGVVAPDSRDKGSVFVKSHWMSNSRATNQYEECNAKENPKKIAHFSQPGTVSHLLELDRDFVTCCACYVKRQGFSFVISYKKVKGNGQLIGLLIKN